MADSKARGGAGRSGRGVSARNSAINSQLNEVSRQSVAIMSSPAYTERPLKGYYNGRENKRRTLAYNEAKAKLDALKTQSEALRKQLRR